MRSSCSVKTEEIVERNGHARLVPLAQGSVTALAPKARSRFAGKAWAGFLAMLYPLLILAPLVTFAVLSPGTDHSRTEEVGIDCAVVVPVASSPRRAW